MKHELAKRVYEAKGATVLDYAAMEPVAEIVGGPNRTEVASLMAAAPQLLDFAMTVCYALTNECNRVWPTAHKWTKKERDEQLLRMARDLVAKLPA